MVPNADVGVDIDAKQLRSENDAVVICTGATWPRDLKIPNRDADGIHFAMEFLQVRIPFFSGLLSRDTKHYSVEHKIALGFGPEGWGVHQRQRKGCYCHRRWRYWK